MYCNNCGAELPEQARFCTNCGTPTGVGSPSKGSSNLGQGRLNQFSNGRNKQYPLPIERFNEIIDKVQEWLEAQDLELQRVPVDDDTTFMQVRSKGGWKKFIGMSTALSIHFDHVNGQLKVHIGEGKWMDKVATGGISMFVLWPLAVTTAVGVYSQMKLPDKIFNFIDAII